MPVFRQACRVTIAVNALPNPIVTPTADGAVPGIMFCRYMLPDQSEFTCQVSDITEKGAVFLSSSIPSPGQSIIAYLEDLGRIEGTTGAPRQGGFDVHFSMRGARLDRLRQRIEWLRNKAAG